MLRGRALEIVDDQGRVRANILVHGLEQVNSQTYPETVLLRLIDPEAGPVVKLTAAANGSALGLSDGHSEAGGVQLKLSAWGGRLVGKGVPLDRGRPGPQLKRNPLGT